MSHASERSAPGDHPPEHGASEQGRHSVPLSSDGLRLMAVLAITGGVLNALSDLMLRYGPVAGEDVTFELMATMPYAQTFAGAVIGGGIAIPLWLFALPPLYVALRPGGHRRAIGIVLLFAHLFVISAIYHSAYALFGAIYAASAHTPDTEILLELRARVAWFDRVFVGAWAVLATTGSIGFISAVLTGRTAFDRWALALTPLLCVPATGLATQLPAPVGGYIRPMTGTLVMTLFFVQIARAVWGHQASAGARAGSAGS